MVDGGSVARRARRSGGGILVAALVAAAAVLASGCASGETAPATDVTDTAATLHALGNANGKSTTYWFDYGPTTAYGSSTAHADGGSGSSPQYVSQRITGLARGTTYHFRVSAQSAGEGVVHGHDRTFTTPAAGSELLPDLVQTLPANVSVQQSGASYRLGFASALENHGAGPLEIRGHRPDTSSPMVADQIVQVSGSQTPHTYAGIGSMIFYAPHNHWHYLGVDRYELRNPATYALIAPDQKMGFCLGDRYDRDFDDVSGPWSDNNCLPGDTSALAVDEGISVGFGDDYQPQLEGQYIDVTSVSPGYYTLVHRANADHSVHESNYDNDASSLYVQLWPNGYGVSPGVSVVRSCPGTDRCTAAASAAPAVAPAGPTNPSRAAVMPARIRSALITTRLDPPLLTGRAARHLATQALVRRFGRTARHATLRCRRASRRSYRCAVAWRTRRGRYRGQITVSLPPRNDQHWWTYRIAVRRPGATRIVHAAGRVRVRALTGGP